MAGAKGERIEAALSGDAGHEMSAAYFGQLLGAVGEQLSQLYDDATGLTRNQNRILVALMREDGLTQTEIAHRLDMHKVSVGLHIAELEALNLVAREAHPTDGRAKCIHLTSHLKTQVPHAQQAFARIHATATEGIAPHDYLTMIDCLSRMHDNLARMNQAEEDLPAATKQGA
ncbi:DNA-binding MarR family transcriptional regulator [Parvibaculum indicum]|uniref:MarR family winged helix-turn-helix transcriptional regulator n=1 Tax=Parvibaculum indicum TaxID=562969 RepID=UPI00141F342E|nr:MarR family transcriptional regulator [Parvibaculum indicum]NIJ39975.1 DNA-binding MarR family transcriptional regulator [Parvibaculum indicum]